MRTSKMNANNFSFVMILCLMLLRPLLSATSPVDMLCENVIEEAEMLKLLNGYQNSNQNNTLAKVNAIKKAIEELTDLKDQLSGKKKMAVPKGDEDNETFRITDDYMKKCEELITLWNSTTLLV